MRHDSMWRQAARLALATSLVHATAATSAAQPCATTTSRVGLAEFGGKRIRSLRIDARRPQRLPGVGALLDRFHVSTRASTVRRELLFAAGDTVDTLAVAESMRRLRALGYLGDVRLDARTCGDSAGVALTVVTEDARSERPILKVRPSAFAVGVAETNTLGTGRGVMLALQTGADGTAGTALVRDPTLLDGRVEGQFGTARFAGGTGWFVDAQTRRRDIADVWIGEAGASLSERDVVRDVPRGTGTALDRVRMAAIGGHRVSRAAAASSITYLLGGVERERVDVAWSRAEPTVGPSDVRRSFAGVDVGAARHAATFDTLTWLLPRDGIVDVPRGVEAELVVAPGFDRADGRSKAHVDGWIGRAWRLGARGLAVGDAWASGYGGHGAIENGTVRASLVAVAAAPHGAWRAQVAAERLLSPDPTTRTLASVDPAGALLPHDARLAEGAMGGSIERTLRLRAVTRRTALDGAVFGSMSYRWDPAADAATTGVPGGDRLGAALLGVGLRLAPTHSPLATVRADVGYPVWRVGSVRRRPVFGLSITPWLLTDRNRDGRGAP